MNLKKEVSGSRGEFFCKLEFVWEMSYNSNRKCIRNSTNNDFYIG